MDESVAAPMDVVVPVDEPDPSPGPVLDEDCLQTVLSLLPFQEKVKCELVCRSWRAVAVRLVRSQKVLGNAPTRLDLVDHCANPRHWVTELDTLPKQMLTNLSLLPKILLKCPDLRAIAITRSREPTFTEAANVKRRTDTSDREDETRELHVEEEENEPFPFDNVPDGFHRMRMVLNPPPGMRPHPVDERARLQGRIMMYHRQRMQQRAAAPRPSNEEDFLDIVAKYVPKLECIDVSGLKLCRGYRAGADEAGAWKLVTANCGATIQHVKTFYMRDKELRALLNRCVHLTDVSIIYGLKGDYLSSVRPQFARMSIGSVKEFGLQQLVQAPDLHNFRELSLSNTNRSMISILAESMRQITTLNLSLTMYNLTANDLCRVAYLSHLKHLYVKRRHSSGPFEDFDQPFCEILRRCPDLETIRLTNMVVTDVSMKQITDVKKLKELSVLFTASKGEKTLTDRSLCRIALLPFLRKCRIDYPNTFTENTLIDFLFKAFSLRDLLLHGCRELIPIKEILQAAIRQAISMQRQQRSLSIDIDTREKILIESVRTFCKHMPKNLLYTISTGEDFYSTHHHYERPAKDPLADEDFDEHESFLYELQHV